MQPNGVSSAMLIFLHARLKRLNLGALNGSTTGIIFKPNRRVRPMYCGLANVISMLRESKEQRRLLSSPFARLQLE